MATTPASDRSPRPRRRGIIALALLAVIAVALVALVGAVGALNPFDEETKDHEVEKLLAGTLAEAS